MTDAYVEVEGKTLEEAFENAALAMFDVMTETASVQARETERLAVQGHDEYSLLYNWLEALLVKFDIEGKLYRRFKISKIALGKDTASLDAEIGGEAFEPSRHRRKVEVKAITYHRMEILRSEEGVRLRYILDL